MKKYVIPTALLGALLIFQNCSDVSFQNVSADALQGPTDTEIEEVNVRCQNAAAQNRLLDQTFTITFEDPKALNNNATPVCQWDSGGNTTRLDQSVTARYEQIKPLQLPNNSDICDAEFTFQEQDMRYDDQFFFLLNNKVLASNALFAVNRLQKTNYSIAGRTLQVANYDWSKIVSAPWPEGFNNSDVSTANNYCLGRTDNFGNCKWPITETTGKIEMSFDPVLVRALGLEGMNARHELGFVTTGDNDQSSDCQHKPITFSIRVFYVAR